MKLVVVESPAKIKSIKKYLGKGYEVKASMGHFVDLPKSDMGVEVDKKFKPKYVVTNKKALTELKRAFNGMDGLIVATDPDREGEAIGWHVANRLGLITNTGKPKREKTLERIVFSSITKGAVQDAVKKPREIDYNLFNAQQARRVLDRLVGYSLSPLLWKKIRYGLSAGRVQSVALRLVVEREEEREAFVAEEYWSLKAFTKNEKLKIKSVGVNIVRQDNSDDEKEGEQKTISSDGVLFDLSKVNNKKVKIENEAQVKVLVEAVKGVDWKITKVETKESKRYPKPPFTTSTLQQTASSWLGMSPKRTMFVAQKLYEAGIITYMRTDSTNLVADAVDSARSVVSKYYGNEYIPDKPNFYKTKAKVAQEAHEAIRPTDFTKVPKESGLKDEKLRLYTLIWQRAVACQMVPAKVEKGRVEIQLSVSSVIDQLKNIEIEKEKKGSSDESSKKLGRPLGEVMKDGDNKVLFAANGQKMAFPGYLKVYPERFEDQVLPEMKEGDEVFPKELTGRQHFTQPPARYSEATLIKALEANGIGRPSTYVPTISTIQGRKYVEKEGKYFFPSDVGRVVTHFLKDHFREVVGFEFTAKMEESLDNVANGEEDWVKMMEEFYKPFDKNIKKKDAEVDRETYTVLGEAPEGIECPDCKGKMNIKLGKYGKFYSCKKWPECKGMLGEDGKSDSDRDQELQEELKSAEFQETYKSAPKTDDGRDYLLKNGRFGKFWAHPDYPKVKDARPLEYTDEIKEKIYGKAPKGSDGKELILRRGRFGEFWAHPDYPKVKEVVRINKKEIAEKKEELGLK